MKLQSIIFPAILVGAIYWFTKPRYNPDPVECPEGQVQAWTPEKGYYCIPEWDIPNGEI